MASGIEPAWVSAGASIVTALIAATALWIAKRQFALARETREAQTKPFVVCDFEDSESGDSISVVLSNLGQTAARDVCVHFAPGLPAGIGGQQPLDRQPFPRPIPQLAPGRRLVTTYLFTGFFGAKDELLSGTVRHEVTVEYKYGRDKAECEVLDLDASHLLELERIRSSSGERETRRALKNIADGLKTLNGHTADIARQLARRK